MSHGLDLPLARRADFRLGAATVRPSRLLVEGPGGAVAAEPKAMQLLLAFVDAGGAVLTRDDLMASCWKGRTVGDDSVNRVIAELRRVARAADAGFRIENIPRTGYRLVDDCPPAATDLAAQAAVTAPPDPTGPVSRRWVVAGSVAALGAGGLALWAARQQAPDPEVERLLAEARIALRPGMPATDREAIALIEQAAARAPDNAEAWGLLALARARAGEHAAPDEAVSPASAIERAAERALARDPANADAKAALALAIPYYGDWLAAERRFDSVLAEHPRHLATRNARAFLLGAVGRMRESALARLTIAPDGSFDAGAQYGLIYGLWFLGRIAEADRVASRAMEIWPRHYGVWFGRLWLLAGTGRIDRALVQIADAAGRPELPPPLVGTLRAAMEAAESRQPAAIDAAADRVMASASRSVASVVTGMMLLNQMGAIDQAFDLARAYYLEQGPVIAAMQWRPGQPAIHDSRRRKTNMLFTPTAETMQRDPRFAPLVEQMGLVHYWEKRGIGPDYLR